MKHLKKKEIQELRAILESEREKVINHVKKLSEAQELMDTNLNAGDTADLANIEVNQNSLSKIGSRELKLIKKIDDSLRKMDEGSYGICEECGEPIPYKRLLVRPVAKLCIECQTQKELREKRYSTGVVEEEEAFESGEESGFTSVIEED